MFLCSVAPRRDDSEIGPFARKVKTLKPTDDGVRTFQSHGSIESFCSGSNLLLFYSTSSGVIITVIVVTIVGIS